MKNAGTHRGDHMRRDHYAEVTAQIVAALETGTPPWRRPWDQGKAIAPMTPHNATTGARYRGINTLVLGMSPLALMSGDQRWATYKQAAERGWQVRKGSRGTTVFFYKPIEVGERDGAAGDGDKRVVPLLRAFTVFHSSQIDGIPSASADAPAKPTWEPVPAMQTIATNSGADIRTGGDRAFYAPSTDHVQMPPTTAFRSAAAHASVLGHELARWTAAPSRLNRDLRNRFGSCDYAREELVAELTQVMLCATLQVDDCEWTNGAAYISSWLTTLKNDRREIFRAAAQAQRAADYLLAFHPTAGKDRRTGDEGSVSPDAGDGDTAERAEPMREAA